MLEDDLLEKEEGALVVDLLPDLHHSLPRVRCRDFVAVLAVMVVNLVHNDERLLQDGTSRYLVLDRQLDLDTTRMLKGV